MSGDAVRRADHAGFSDALTYSFADPDGRLCGVARLGVSGGAASGLVVVFSGGEAAAVVADGEGEAADTWHGVRAAGISTEGEGPWRLRFDGEVELDLEFTATAEPIELAGDSEAGRAGGMSGFDHVCRVAGRAGGRPFEGRGQRARSWGAPDWERMALARTLTAWFDDDRAISAIAVRGAKARSHGDEVLAAYLVEGAPVPAADPRLSTTYDAEGRQRAAGLELYVGEEDDHARRAAGELVAGTTLDLGRLRLDCAFFSWRMEGRRGIGRYDVLRRV